MNRLPALAGSSRIRHAIVTGGSSGIGKAMGCLLAGEGADVSVIARDEQRLEAARSEIERRRARPEQRVVTVSADVSVRPEAERAVAKTIVENGPPDLLVTCAGIAEPGYFQHLPTEVFEQTMAVNYFGTLYAIRAALPVMAERGHGHLALVSSAVGLLGVFGYSAYSPSKMAVRGLAETLRAELKPLGIGVSVVYPPDTDTPQLEREARSKPSETRLIARAAGLRSSDEVARAMLRGIRKRTFAIAPGPRVWLLASLHSVVAPVLSWYVDRTVARARRSALARRGPRTG